MQHLQDCYSFGVKHVRKKRKRKGKAFSKEAAYLVVCLLIAAVSFNPSTPYVAKVEADLELLLLLPLPPECQD